MRKYCTRICANASPLSAVLGCQPPAGAMPLTRAHWTKSAAVALAENWEDSPDNCTNHFKASNWVTDSARAETGADTVSSPVTATHIVNRLTPCAAPANPFIKTLLILFMTSLRVQLLLWNAATLRANSESCQVQKIGFSSALAVTQKVFHLATYLPKTRSNRSIE